MTRGTAVLFTDHHICFTNEFNGDMYPEGWGVDLFLTLMQCDDEKSFAEAMDKWNSTHHNYDSFTTHMIAYDNYIADLTPSEESTLEVFTMDKNVITLDMRAYHWDFTSDYMFFKNVSNYDVKIVLRSTKKSRHNEGGAYKLLKKGEGIILRFGGVCENVKLSNPKSSFESAKKCYTSLCFGELIMIIGRKTKAEVLG